MTAITPAALPAEPVGADDLRAWHYVIRTGGAESHVFRVFTPP